MPERHSPRQDWHREDIKAAIRKTGLSCEELGLKSGFSRTAVRTALTSPWSRMQVLIATHIGRKPEEIWPSRYDAEGRPLDGRSRNGGARTKRGSTGTKGKAP